MRIWQGCIFTLFIQTHFIVLVQSWCDVEGRGEEVVLIRNEILLMNYSSLQMFVLLIQAHFDLFRLYLDAINVDGRGEAAVPLLSWKSARGSFGIKIRRTSFLWQWICTSKGTKKCIHEVYPKFLELKHQISNICITFGIVLAWVFCDT